MRRSVLAAGNWRLVYSSAFATTGSFGGSRPGPPAFLSPFRLGQVFQRIRPKAQTLDNVVELILPGLPGQSPPVVQVCLRCVRLGSLLAARRQLSSSRGHWTPRTLSRALFCSVSARLRGTSFNMEGAVAGAARLG